MATAALPQTETSSESDIRLDILNSLMTCPHGELDLILEVHHQMINQDPLFYARLAAWYAKQSSAVRDHGQAFTVSLLLSRFDGHRQQGRDRLHDLGPKPLLYVVRAALKIMKNDRSRAGSNYQVLRKGVISYLRAREADNAWLDSIIVSARKAVKQLYVTMRIKPSQRANDILFKRIPPSDSRVAQLAALSKLTDPTEQAKAIVEHKIPYRIAVGVVDQVTAPIMLALVEVMTPQELITNLAAIKRRGAFDIPEVKDRIDAKLEKAKTSKNVAGLKAQKAVEKAGLNEEDRQRLNDVADTQMKAKGRISRNTMMIVDKSASMGKALEIAQRLGALVSSVMTPEAKLSVFACDTMPYPVECESEKLEDWEAAFRGIVPGGGTALGSAFLALDVMNNSYDQFVIVSDGGENNRPLFSDQYQQYCQKHGTRPNVVYVHIPVASASQNLRRFLTQASIEFDFWEVKTDDYFALPQVITMLAKPGKLELLIEIMNTPIPKRKVA